MNLDFSIWLLFQKNFLYNSDSVMGHHAQFHLENRSDTLNDPNMGWFVCYVQNIWKVQGTTQFPRSIINMPWEFDNIASWYPHFLVAFLVPFFFLDQLWLPSSLFSCLGNNRSDLFICFILLVLWKMLPLMKLYNSTQMLALYLKRMAKNIWHLICIVLLQVFI